MISLSKSNLYKPFSKALGDDGFDESFLEHKPDYFLSDIDSFTWELSANDKTHFFDEIRSKWIGTERINWDVTLINGEQLSATKYERLLKLVQSFVLAARTPSIGLVTRSSQQRTLANSFKLLVNWMIRKGFQVELTGFSELTKVDLEQFCIDAQHGVFGIMGYQTRIEHYLDTLDDKSNIDVRALKNHCCEHKAALINSAISAIIEDFTLEDDEFEFESERVSKNHSREFEDAKSKEKMNFRDRLASESSLDYYLKSWQTLGRLSSVFEHCNSKAWLLDISPRSIASDLGYTENGRTCSIPIETGLFYLNEAMHWVKEYSKEILELRDICNSAFSEIRRKAPKSKIDHIFKRVNESVDFTENSLGIKRYNLNPTGTTIKQIKENLSVEEALESLQAACFITIGTFTARRLNEILFLRSEGLIPSLDGGWNIIFGLEKGSPEELLEKIARPIPDIVYEATDILLRINAPLLDGANEVLSSRLFLYDVIFREKTGLQKPLSREVLYRRIDLFADLISVPLNSEGKRWYIKSHELRRFFAIAYYWHDKYADLDALRWFMGHTDKEQTFRYISEIIGGSELPEEEARYSASILMSGLHETQTQEIKEEILNNFSVGSISMIDPDDLHDYLETLFKSGTEVHIEHVNGEEKSNPIFIKTIEE